jgi:glycosyltransferase involved in cell wall biosynthesis
LVLAWVFESVALTVWFWATCLIGLVWLRRHVDLWRGRREPILIPDEPGLELESLPALTVLVAAKDEEANIARCLSGLLGQDYPRLQVVVANDRSTDRTGQIIDEFAAADPRVTVVHVRELRPGWFGKNNAMREGVERARGQWLCFSDADCAYDSPRLLTAAVRYALREGVDFLSVLPRLEQNSFWERVVQPVAGAIMVLWFSPNRVNDPASPCAYANGAFMLMSRTAYERLGGHEPVKATLNEDMHMARRAKRIGLRLRVIRGGDMYRVRMYSGLRQIWCGWSRIFYGCFGTLPKLLGSVAMLAFFSLSPYLTLLLAPLSGPGWPWLAAAAGLALLAQQSVLWLFYRMGGSSPVWALSYPLGAAVCLGMTVNAMRRLGGGVSTTWRGTTYTGGAQVVEDGGEAGVSSGSLPHPGGVTVPPSSPAP